MARRIPLSLTVLKLIGPGTYDTEHGMLSGHWWEADCAECRLPFKQFHRNAPDREGVQVDLGHLYRRCGSCRSGRKERKAGAADFA